MLPMKSLHTQQRLDRRYSTQADLIGFFYLFGVFIGRAFHQLQLLLHLQRFTAMDVSLLFKEFDCLRPLAFLLLSLGQGFFHLLEFCQQGFSFCRQIRERSCASVHILRTSRCRCSCASHQQGASPSSSPQRVGHEQVYRQDVG